MISGVMQINGNCQSILAIAIETRRGQRTKAEIMVSVVGGYPLNIDIRKDESSVDYAVGFENNISRAVFRCSSIVRRLM